MTDRELLELAAKAAAYDVRWHENWQCFVHVGVVNINTPPTMAGQRQVWNPLTDDGDALRLAVKLNRTDIGALIMNYTTGAEYRDCPYAATRRAIVRAAAEIGKGMK